MTIDDIGVHETHCCARHGCRYGNTPRECPVVGASVKQRFLCDVCDLELEQLEDDAATIPPGVELHTSDKICEEWIMYTPLGDAAIVIYYSGQIVLNTAPYPPIVVKWLAAKASLAEIKGLV